MIITQRIKTGQIGTGTQQDTEKKTKQKNPHRLRSKAKSCSQQDTDWTPWTSRISLQNIGSHGNLNLIHKSPAPIQSNLIPSGQGPLQPAPHLPPKLLYIICMTKIKDQRAKRESERLLCSCDSLKKKSWKGARKVIHVNTGQYNTQMKR